MPGCHLVQVPSVAALLVLAACGGEPDRDEAPRESAAPEAAPTRTPAPTPAPAPARTPAQPSASGSDLADVSLADLTGDATAGKTVFTKCMACHSIEPGVNRVGPHLHDVVGREAGAIADFNYSEANRNSGITWSREVLFDYLVAPQQYVPGTRMTFPGLKNPQDRADIIAYLEAKSGT